MDFNANDKGLSAAFTNAQANSDKLGASIKRLNGTTQTANSGFSNFVKTAKSLAVALGGLLVIKDIVNTYKDFEQAVANAASVTGAFGDALDATKANITDVAKELGKTTVFSASEAANAFYDLASAGYDVANMTTDELRPVLDLAAGTQSDLAFATETVTGALSSLGLGFDSSQRVADVFSKTIASSKATLDKLNQSYQLAGASLQSFGVEIEDANAALAVLYNRNIDGSRAGNILRNALNRTAKITPQGTEVLEKYGISLQDLNVEARGLVPVLETLNDANISNADSISLFGQEYGAFTKVLIDNVEEMENLSGGLDEFGFAGRVAEAQLDTLAGSMQLLKSNVESLKIALGEALAPVIREVAGAFGQLAANESFQGFLSGLASAIAELVRAFIPILKAIFTFVGVVGQVLIPVVKGLAGTLRVLSPLITGAAVAFGAWKILTTATLWVKALNVALRTQSVLLGTSGVLRSISNVIASIGAFAVSQGAAATATGVATGALRAFAAALISTPIGQIALAIGAAVAAFKLFKKAFDSNFLGIADRAREIITVIREEFGPLIEAAKRAWEFISNAARIAYERVREIATSVLKYITDFWTKQFTEIANFIKGFIKILSGDFSAGFKQIISAVFSFAKNFVKFWFDAIKAVGKFLLAFARAAAGVFGDLIKIIGAVIKDLATQWRTILSNMIIILGRWAANVFTIIANIDWGGALKAFGSAISNALKSAWNAIKNFASNAFNVIKNIFSGKKGDAGEVDLEVQIESSGTKKTLLQDLFDGLDEVEFSNTEAAIADIGDKYADIFDSVTPELSIDTEGAEEGLNGVENAAGGATDAAADLNAELNETGGAGGGAADEAADAYEQLGDIIKAGIGDFEEGVEKHAEAFGKIADIDKETLDKRIDYFKEANEALLDEGFDKSTVENLGNEFKNVLEAIDAEIVAGLKRSLDSNLGGLEEAIDAFDNANFDIDTRNIFEIPDINADAGGDEWLQFWEDYEGNIESVTERVKELLTEQAAFFDDLRKSTQDIKKELAGLESEGGQELAQELVRQEERLAELRSEIADEQGQDDPNQDRIRELQEEASQIQAALNDNKDLYQTYADEIAEIKRRSSANELDLLREDLDKEKAILEERLLINQAFFEDAELNKPKDFAQAQADLQALKDEIKNEENVEFLEQLLQEQQKRQTELEQARLFLEESNAQRETLEIQFQNKLDQIRADELNAFQVHLATQEELLEAHKNAQVARYNAIAAAARAAASAGGGGGGGGGGFAKGGFTGVGSPSKVAGVVHKGEYVIPNPVLKKLQPTGMLGMLEGMRKGIRGFAEGGFTSPFRDGTPSQTKNVSVTINNNERERRTGVGGGELLYLLRKYA